MRYEISEYHGGRDKEVAALVLSIQNDEAGLDLSVADQPDLIDIAAAYRDGGFWIAVADGKIVGTIGLLDFGSRAALKKFFVAEEHRGHGGPATPLFLQLVQTARVRGYRELFLDTPSAATRSHDFYRRAGFRLGEREDLPAGYDYPDRNSHIFRLAL